MKRPIPAYILAGGRSRRMGRDKATLRPDATAPMLAQTVAAILRAAGCSPVWVVGRQPSLQQVGLPVVPDPIHAQHHPLLGVAAALAHAAATGATYAFISPCDTPSLLPDTVAALCAGPGPAVAVSDGHLQPLLACLPTTWAGRAQLAAEAQASARSFVDHPSVARVQVPAAQAADLDTPMDLASWHNKEGRHE